MKVLILTNSIGGLYRFRKELVIELLNENEISISAPVGDATAEFKNMGCNCIDTLIPRRGKNPLKELALLRNYKKIIKSIDPDLVLTYTIKPNIYGGLACQKCKKPYIVNITGLGDAIENKGILQKILLFLYKKGLKKAKHVFFQNADNQKEFIGFRTVDERITSVLPGSGVNLSEHKFEEYPEESDKLVFITIGRILRDKGIRELIGAVKVLKSRHDDLTFRLIGPMEEDFQSLVESAVDEGLIEYWGPRKDIHEIIKNSNATIHPSYHEGTSNVLLETASCGRPVIATNVPGCKNTFDDEVSGISFEPRSVESLVNAVEEFIEMPYEMKKQMGRMARDKAEKEFDRKIVIKEYNKQIAKVFAEGDKQ